MCKFSQKLRNCFTSIKMVDAQVFLSVFGDFSYYFRFIFNETNEKKKYPRITIIHVYFSALTLAVSLESRLILGFKHIPLATSNVNP